MDPEHDEHTQIRQDLVLDRRSLLKLAGGGLAGLVLVACGGDTSAPGRTPTAGTTGAVSSTSAPQAGATAASTAAAAAPATGATAASTAAGPAASNLTGDLVIWTFFDQVEDMGAQFGKKHPGVKVDVKVFPGDQYQTKARLALQSGQSAPDIFDLERGYIGKFIDSPFAEDLTAMGAEDLLKDYVPYVAELGKDSNGVVRAVTDHSSPGGFWYRRDVAEQYLGTDDPAEVSEQVADWDKIVELGKQVAQESGGKIHLLASYSDVIMVNQYHMEPWVQDGKLNIDPEWNEVLDTARSIRENNVDAKLDAFSPAWGNAWNNGSVLMFAWPSWAGFLVDREKTGGKWGIARAPKGYYAGGTYRAIYTRSKNKELAFEFVKYIASPEWQDYNLKKTLNMPGLQTVYQQNEDTFEDPLMAGQPVLQTYFPIAMDVPPRRADKYGEDIQSAFNEAVSTMIKNKQPNETAFEDLKKRVRSTYPELTVE